MCEVNFFSKKNDLFPVTVLQESMFLRCSDRFEGFLKLENLENLKNFWKLQQTRIYCLLYRIWSGPITSWRRRIWMRLFLCLRTMMKRIYQSTSSPSLLPPTSRAPPRTPTPDDLSNSRCSSTTMRGTSW